jgi:hypothetical protein
VISILESVGGTGAEEEGDIHHYMLGKAYKFCFLVFLAFFLKKGNC